MIAHLNLLITDLRAAKKPVLMVGGGARNSDVAALSIESRIPAYPTWNALDIITSDLPTYAGRIGTYGGAGRNFGIQNADLLIAIGTRISGRITGGKPETFTPNAKRWLIDISPDWNPVEIHERVQSDAGTFVTLLLAALKGEWLPDYSQWLSRCIGWRNRYNPVELRFFGTAAPHPYAFARMLSEKCAVDAVIVTDCGGNVVVMNQAFETTFGQRYFSNNGNSPMGFSFCGAMGAWFADPKRQVICVIGDGGFNMNIQELQTVVNYGCKIKVFILDNRVYGITKAYQRTNKGGRYEACGPVGYSPPDFEKIATAYGVAVTRITDGQRMESGIRKALNHDGAMVCIVDCPEFSTYEPRISGWDTPIHDMDPKLSREELAENMNG